MCLHVAHVLQYNPSANMTFLESVRGLKATSEYPSMKRHDDNAQNRNTSFLSFTQRPYWVEFSKEKVDIY